MGILINMVRLIACLILLAIAGTSCAARAPLASPPGTVTTFILLRHAERPGENDPGALSPRGFERAAALVEHLRDTPIDAVHAPATARNLATAQPLCDARGLTLVTWPETDLLNPPQLMRRVTAAALRDHPGGTLVWVGNASPTGVFPSNLQVMVDLLGAEIEPPHAYGQIVTLRLDDAGHCTGSLTTFGP